MQDNRNINIIVSNILNENRYSHCRLCLKYIKEYDEYVLFDDLVTLDATSEVFQPLSEVLTRLLDESIRDEITGIEAVCTDCVNSALTSLRFIEQCQNSSNIISKVFENLSNTLSANINTDVGNKSLYLEIHELETTAFLVDKPKKKYKQHISKNSYQCIESSCEEFFESFADLKFHNIIIHGTQTCDKCLETFSNDEDLASHEIHGHKYRCPDCPQCRNTSEALWAHHTQAHNVYVCKECGKTCHGLDKLHRHEEKHTSKKVCPKCGKAYSTIEFYEKHVNLCLKNLIDPYPTRSTMEKTHVCEKCDKAYSTPGGLRVHNRFAHGNAKPHVCPECGKKFTAPSYLKVHMIKHTGVKDFKCGLCNRRFVSKEALLYHTRRHTGEKPYSCKICSERFVNASARAEHMKFKHVGPTLMCEICSRKFVTSNFLKQHISKHHDPTSKLYYGREMIPPNLPVVQNMKKRFIVETEV